MRALLSYAGTLGRYVGVPVLLFAAAVLFVHIARANYSCNQWGGCIETEYAAGPVSAWITGTGCTLPQGGGTCNVKLSWGELNSSGDELDITFIPPGGTESDWWIGAPGSATNVTAAATYPGTFTYIVYDHGHKGTYADRSGTILAVTQVYVGEPSASNTSAWINGAGCTLDPATQTCNLSVSWGSVNTNSNLVDISFISPGGTESAWWTSAPANEINIGALATTPGTFTYKLYNHGTNTLLASTDVTVDQAPDRAPLGAVETLDCDNFVGWTFDPDDTSNPNGILMYISDTSGNYQNAQYYDPNVYRSDIDNSYGISGTHGFSVPIPDALKDGQAHLVNIIAYDTWGGYNPDLTHGGKVMRCAAGAPSVSVSGQGCTLNGSSCTAYLTYTASNTSGGETDIKETAPDGTVSTQTAQPGSGTLSFQVSQAGSYTFGVYNHGQNFSSGSLLGNVSVPVYAKPTLTCNGTGSCTISAGGNATLSWTCASPSDRTTLADFPTGGAISGSAVVSPTVSTTYNLQCQPSGSRTSTTVFVGNPKLTLTSSPAKVRAGSTATLTWSGSNVSSCTLTGPGVSQSGLSGSVTTPTLTSQAVYTLTCQSGVGPISIQKTVNLVPELQEK